MKKCIFDALLVGEAEAKLITKMFTVAKEGKDEEKCLTHQSSCNTIGYIIENECSSHVHLVINLKFEANFTFKEQHFTSFSKASHKCSATISGESNLERPKILFDERRSRKDLPEDHNIFEMFLNETDNITDSNRFLTIKNLIILSLNLALSGQLHFSAANTDFVDLELTVDALSEMPCYFQCKSCTFSVSQNDTITRKHRHGQIFLLHCLSLSFELQDCSFSSATIELTFLSFCNVHMENIDFDQDISSEASSVSIHQIETHGPVEQTLPGSSILLTNVSVTNNKALGYFFSFHFLSQNAIGSASFVQLNNCTSMHSSYFLRYFVETFSDLSSQDAYSLEHLHKLLLFDCKISFAETQDEDPVLIVNNIGGLIVFIRCHFSGNNFEESSFVSIEVSRVFLKFTDCNFTGNTGYDGSSLHVKVKYMTNSILLHSSVNSSTTFTSQINFDVEAKDLILLDKSTCVIQLQNCMFANNKGSYIAGGLFVEKQFTSFSEESSNLIQLVLQSENCTFQNNKGHLRVTGFGIDMFSFSDVAPDMKVLISKCVFSDNFVTADGAGASLWFSFHFSPSHLTEVPALEFVIFNCTFVNNSAGVGGAVALSFRQIDLIFTLSNSQFYGNKGREGGALEIDIDHGRSTQNSTICFSSSVFSHNFATRMGSAVNFKLDSSGPNTMFEQHTFF